ncbi:hypothetical protein, partial [Barnesiella intestinihominis]|uniref:hypothetical protein n=1 Tax=Barnesiella intestinihominis TaxID=487174 RepID=UPI003A896BEC
FGIKKYYTRKQEKEVLKNTSRLWTDSTLGLLLFRIIKIAPFLLGTKVGQQLIRTFLSMS